MIIGCMLCAILTDVGTLWSLIDSRPPLPIPLLGEVAALVLVLDASIEVDIELIMGGLGMGGEVLSPPNPVEADGDVLILLPPLLKYMGGDEARMVSGWILIDIDLLETPPSRLLA